MFKKTLYKFYIFLCRYLYSRVSTQEKVSRKLLLTNQIRFRSKILTKLQLLNFFFCSLSKNLLPPEYFLTAWKLSSRNLLGPHGHSTYYYSTYRWQPNSNPHFLGHRTSLPLANPTLGKATI